MKKNYAAWHIDYDEFFSRSGPREKLSFLAQFGVLAPSTHNSQPWSFSISDNAIAIEPDLDRSLAVSDPALRHLYISLGCVAENIVMAAEYYRLKPIVSYEKGAAGTVIMITFPNVTGSKNELPPEKHLIAAIVGRRSNRTKFLSRPVDPAVLAEIGVITIESAHISVITDEAKKNEIAEFLMAARVNAFSHRPFREEMAGYKRNDFTSSYTGMPGFTMDFNPLTSLIAGFAIRNFNVIKLLRKSETEILTKYTPAFLFVVSDAHEIPAWIASGRVLERALVVAEHHGVQASLSALPPDVSPLERMINTSARPQMFIRMGYAKKIPGHSPRIPAEDVIREK